MSEVATVGDGQDDEPQILNINLDAQRGTIDIVATMPNVAMLAAECTELLSAHEAKNYVQFDMIPRAESGVEGYRVTVQRLHGKSPAQRVNETERQIATLELELAQLRAQVAEAEEQAEKKVRQAESVLKEVLAAQGEWEPVPDGTYKTKHGDGLISFGGGQLSVSQIKARMNIFVGTLPDGWVLARPKTELTP